MAKLVSKVYGNALMDAALEEECFQQVLDEVKMLKLLIQSEPNFLKVSLAPTMTSEEKQNFLERLFGNEVSDITKGFLGVLLRKGHMDELESVLDYFEVCAKEHMNIGVAHITTAVECSDMQREKIKDKLLSITKYKTFEMHYAVDPTLIGGMTLRIGDRVVDDSIRAKLDKMKEGVMKA